MTLQTVGRSPISEVEQRLSETVTIRTLPDSITTTGMRVNGNQILVVGLNSVLDNKGRVTIAFPDDLYPYSIRAVLFHPATPAITSVSGFRYVGSPPLDEKVILLIPGGEIEAGATVFGELYLVKKEALFPE